MSRPASDRRGVFAWMLFDWANQPFQTLIVTFIFAPYFVAEVIGDPVRGQALWGAAAAVAGAIVAILAPLLGAMADRTGARKRWMLAFSVPYVLGCAGFWLATPGMARPRRSSSSSTPSPSSAPSSASLHQRHAARPRPARGDRPHLRLGLGARLPRRARVARLRPPLPRARPGRHRDAARHRADPRPRPRRSASRRAPPARSRRSGTWSSRCPSSSIPPTSRRGAPPASSAPASPISARPSGSRPATGASSPSLSPR